MLVSENDGVDLIFLKGKNNRQKAQAKIVKARKTNVGSLGTPWSLKYYILPFFFSRKSPSVTQRSVSQENAF